PPHSPRRRRPDPSSSRAGSAHRSRSHRTPRDDPDPSSPPGGPPPPTPPPPRRTRPSRGSDRRSPPPRPLPGCRSPGPGNPTAPAPRRGEARRSRVRLRRIALPVIRYAASAPSPPSWGPSAHLPLHESTSRMDSASHPASLPAPPPPPFPYPGALLPLRIPAPRQRVHEPLDRVLRSDDRNRETPPERRLLGHRPDHRHLHATQVRTHRIDERVDRRGRGERHHVHASLIDETTQLGRMAEGRNRSIRLHPLHLGSRLRSEERREVQTAK